jgi:hypothetical protein
MFGAKIPFIMTAKKEIVPAVAAVSSADKVIDAELISEAEYQRIKALRAAEKARDVPFPIVGIPVILRITVPGGYPPGRTPNAAHFKNMEQNEEMEKKLKLQRETDAKTRAGNYNDWFTDMLRQVGGK